MTTKITKKIGMQFAQWFNIGASTEIQTDDPLGEVMNLLQGTSIAHSINTLRKGNIESIAQQTAPNIDKSNIHRIGPKETINFLEEASKESDPELQKKWSNLLVNGLKGETKIGRYTEILKQLSSEEVKMLDDLYKQYLGFINNNQDQISATNKEIQELEIQINKLILSNTVLYNEYVAMLNSGDNDNAHLLKNRDSTTQSFFSNLETLQGKVPGLTVKLESLKNPDFHVQNKGLDENIGEIIDNLKRLNLIQNASSNNIIMGVETLVTSNKFRFQLTDLGLAFIRACRID